MNNIRSNEKASLCICGQLVVQRPITLPCGHKYHIKCARIHVFGADDSSTKRVAATTLQDENNNTEDEQHFCPLCEKADSPMDLSSSITSSSSSSLQLSTNQKEFPPHRSSQFSNSTSMKYFTPDTSAKYPKNTRYDSNYKDTTPITTKSIHNQQPLNSHTSSSSSASFAMNPAVLNGPRIPLANITPKQQHSSFSSPIIDEFSRNHQMQAFKNSHHLDGVVKVLGTRLLQQAVVASESAQLSSSQQSIMVDLSGLKSLESSEISEIEVRESVGSCCLSFLNQSDSFNQRIRSSRGGGWGFHINNLSQNNLHSQQSQESLPIEQSMKSCMEYSFNQSMMSCGSDKENARNLVTRRARSNTSGITVSFYEGMSFISNNCLLKYEDKNEVRFPFIIEVAVDKNMLSDQNHSKQQQDIVLLISYAQFDMKQRYELIHGVFKQLSKNDRVRLCWIDFQEGVVFNSQCDFFVGNQMADILAREFMRLQAHRESKLDIKKNEEGVNWFQKFIVKQFNADSSSSSRQNAMQHVILVVPNAIEMQVFNLEGYQSMLKQQSGNIENSQLPQISIVNVEGRGQEQYMQSRSQQVSYEEFNQVIIDCCRQIEVVQNIHVRWVEVKLHLNVHLNNMKRITLLNESADVMMLHGSQGNDTSRNSCDMDIEERNSNHNEDRIMTVVVRNLSVNQVVKLVLEAVFTMDEVPMYRNARLFNCDVKYCCYKEGSSSNLRRINNGMMIKTSSMNSTFDVERDDDDSSHDNTDKHVFIQQMTGLYMIIEWRQYDNTSMKQLAKFDRRVIYSLWELEKDCVVGQNGRQNADEVKAIVSQQQYEQLYERYLRIFQVISVRKGTSEYEEFQAFRAFYQSMAIKSSIYS